MTPQPTPPVSSAPAASSISATGPLADASLGQSFPTRTAGPRIERIVIDPGHGGHDTGTIGPAGLMEKETCLDVALRLGRIIKQRLPDAEVIFTRTNDTFVPLEERTHIANEMKADLFLSIHVNSSPDRLTRGMETYYLNVRDRAPAAEVAVRENATAQQKCRIALSLQRLMGRAKR